jgi:hypothetical protein
VTQRSIGSAPAVGEWEVAGPESQSNDRTGTVYFFSTRRPGTFLAITLPLDGSENVVGFEVWQQEQERPTGVVTTRLLRSVPLGRLASVALTELRRRANRSTATQRWGGDSAGQEHAVVRSLALLATPIGGHKRPGRRGHPDDYYARLALEYEEWQRSGDRLSVMAARRFLSEPALRASLGTARRKGFLTPAPPGRAGGSATEKAKRILGVSTEREPA